MCGRYQRKADKQAIAEYFQLGIVEELPLEAAPSYNVAPTSMQPVIVGNRDTGERELRIMRWGLVPSWCWDIKRISTINARAEDIMQKPMWRRALETRRCLVPADGFYEWKKADNGKKQPYSFQLKDGEPFAFAGLWEHWRARDGSLELDSFSIITTEPNELTATAHNRMPVILKSSDYDRWLTVGDTEQPPIDLLRAFDAEKMTTHKVDPRVGNARNNEPELCREWDG